MKLISGRPCPTKEGTLMRFRNRSGLRWVSLPLVAVAAFVVSILTAYPQLLAQSAGANDHWVGTWATALVPRDPRPQPAAQPAQGQPQAGVPQGQAAAGGQG